VNHVGNALHARRLWILATDHAVGEALNLGSELVSLGKRARALLAVDRRPRALDSPEGRKLREAEAERQGAGEPER